MQSDEGIFLCYFHLKTGCLRPPNTSATYGATVPEVVQVDFETRKPNLSVRWSSAEHGESSGESFCRRRKEQIVVHVTSINTHILHVHAIGESLFTFFASLSYAYRFLIYQLKNQY